MLAAYKNNKKIIAKQMMMTLNLSMEGSVDVIFYIQKLLFMAHRRLIKFFFISPI